MRKLISLAMAGVTFCIVTSLITVSVMTALSGRMDSVASYFTGAAFWASNLLTVVSFTFIGSIIDGPLMNIAGRVTRRVRLRYAFAYALLVLAISSLLFLPFGLSIKPIWIPLLTIAIGGSAGFVGGYVRGWMMDTWSKDFEADNQGA